MQGMPYTAGTAEVGLADDGTIEPHEHRSEAPSRLPERARRAPGRGRAFDIPLVADAEAGPRATMLRETRYRRFLALADVLAASLALVASVMVLGDDRLTLVSVAALPIVVVGSKLMGLYDRDEVVLRKTTLDEAPKLFQLATLYALSIWLFEGALVVGGLGRQQVLGLWAILFLAFIVTRAGARVAARTVSPPERCLILGDAAVAARVEEKLAEEGGLKTVVAGRLDLQRMGADRDGALDDVASVVSSLDVHRVIIAPDGDRADLIDLIATVKNLGVRVSVVPRVFEVVGSSVEFDRLGGLTLLGVRRFGRTRSSWLLKRSSDVVASGLLLVVLLPLMATIALAIKLQSGGPVLFRQVRVGRHGQRFEMLKFRTMVLDAAERKAELEHLNEAVGLFKIADDPRLTRVGRLLRRTSLDELPQLLNVLRGDMSLVGPRPLIVDEDERIEGWHRRRLQLTPGMTGHWQVLGSARIPLHEMVTIDYLYAANWSLWLDVKILLRTVPYVFSRRGL